MARSLKRVTAGDRVFSLMDELSASLLIDEELCRQNMEALFVGAVANVAGGLTPLFEHGAREVDAVVGMVMDRAARIVQDTEGPFRSLTLEAVGRGLESIRQELELCERTLGPKFSGLSAEACDGVDDAEGQLMTLAMVQYRANVQPVLVWVRAQLELELRLALSLQESPEQVVARLVSGEPVKAPQHSGRGLWWKVLEHCTRITREIEFATVNAARTEAMVEFNRIGEGRRG